jgi:ribonuclease G
MNLSGAVPPTRILSEQGKTNSILRDLLSPDFNKIVVNDKKIFTETKSYLQKIAPDKLDILAYHSGSNEIFDTHGVMKQIKASFGKTVNMPSGAYLIIEHTEALHVIDVNSGYKSVSNNQEENALETNLEAAAEIARQLRLRDLGGIIVVDFIDMKLMENKKKLADAMEELMRTDRAKHSVLPITKFGLMQITRQRMKPEMNINTSELCPSCNGSGTVSSTLIMEDEIAKNLNYLIMQKHQGLTIIVHPIMHTYLTCGFPSRRLKWMWKYKQKIKVIADTSYHLTEFRFFDNTDEEIKL